MKKYDVKIENLNDFKIHKLDMSKIEPLRNNRFIVEFPKIYQIPQFVVRTVYFAENKEITFDIMEIVGSVYIDKFKNLPKIGNMSIKLLDPALTPIMNIIIDKAKVKKLKINSLSYNDDNILTFSMTIKYKNMHYTLIESNENSSKVK